MDRGAWWATVHGAAEESDTTKLLNNDNKCQMKGFRGVPSSCFCDSEHRSQKPTLVKCFSTMDQGASPVAPGKSGFYARG